MQKIRQVGAELLHGHGWTLFAILGTHLKSIFFNGVLHFLILCASLQTSMSLLSSSFLSRYIPVFCVCVYIYIHTHIHVYIYIYVCKCIYIHTYIHTHTHTYGVLPNAEKGKFVIEFWRHFQHSQLTGAITEQIRHKYFAPHTCSYFLSHIKSVRGTVL